MVLVQLLRRKDASSLIVAFILGMIIWQALSFMTGDLAATLSGLKEGEALTYGPPGASWKQTYLFPAVSALVQIIFLEILARLIILANSMIGKSTKRKT